MQKTKKAAALLLALLLLAAGCAPVVSDPPEAELLQTASPAPTVTQEPWESKYGPVLEAYRAFAAGLKQNKADFSEQGEPWELIAPDMALSGQEPGYAFRDMDGNGTPELFLLTGDGFIWAMYTLAGGAPKLLDAFWPRKLCILDDSDIVYMIWSNGALDSGYDAYRMAEDGNSLTLIKQVAMESMEEDGTPLDAPRYYRRTGPQGEKEIIGKEQADAETDNFPVNNDRGGLVFVPLS